MKRKKLVSLVILCQFLFLPLQVQSKLYVKIFLLIFHNESVCSLLFVSWIRFGWSLPRLTSFLFRLFRLQCHENKQQYWLKMWATIQMWNVKHAEFCFSTLLTRQNHSITHIHINFILYQSNRIELNSAVKREKSIACSQQTEIETDAEISGYWFQAVSFELN